LNLIIASIGRLRYGKDLFQRHGPARVYDECMAFRLVTDAFAESALIPKRFTCEGQDLSPALAWSGEPAGTRSFALIMDDPDAPVRTWNHWLLWNIPRGTHALEERFEPGSTEESGTNDFGKPGYGGPCPPRGHGPHRYYFKLYALHVEKLLLKAGAKRADLDRALKSHMLGKAQYTGWYERR
jgi:Raf kinase inhibitor-like YbhB/YbcL family protein